MRASTLLLLLMLAVPVWSTPMDHVILVSVDGLRSDLLYSLLANDHQGEYANFRRLVVEGAYTFGARTDFTHTVTLPNHTCMVTGRPVLQPDGQPVTTHHGYTSNTDPQPGDTLHDLGNPALRYIAGVFDVAHDHGLTTALYASKSKFSIFDQSYDAIGGAPDVTGPDDGRDKIDIYHQESAGSPANAAGLHAAFMDRSRSLDPPAFSFVHYRDPDSAGHAGGWGSATWNNSVRDVDGYLGEILDFVAANPGLMGRTVLIVTADHGGEGTDHSDPTNPHMYTVPFFAWGTDVAGGEDLYTLNPASRLRPAGGRPDYNAAVAPIRNGDSGNLVLSLLNLPAISGSTINVAQDLVVTIPVAAVPGATGPALVSLRAYPNPFNARVVLSYELARAGDVRITLFDLSGRRVRLLETGQRESGRYELVWDGRDDSGRGVASGLYFYRLETGGVQQTSKLTLAR